MPGLLQVAAEHQAPRKHSAGSRSLLTLNNMLCSACRRVDVRASCVEEGHADYDVLLHAHGPPAAVRGHQGWKEGRACANLSAHSHWHPLLAYMDLVASVRDTACKPSALLFLVQAGTSTLWSSGLCTAVAGMENCSVMHVLTGDRGSVHVLAAFTCSQRLKHTHRRTTCMRTLLECCPCKPHAFSCSCLQELWP